MCSLANFVPRHQSLISLPWNIYKVCHVLQDVTFNKLMVWGHPYLIRFWGWCC